MKDILIIDAHVDTPGYIVDEGYQLAEEHSYYETDIPRMRRGRVGAVFFGVYVQPQDFAPHLWLPRAMEWIDALHGEVGRNSRDMEIAYTADDIVRIHRAGKIAALLSLEGGHLIADSLGLLRDYYRLGVRYMTLAHFKTNNWADSATDKAVHNGLSPFGRDVVREMNRLGMDRGHLACFRQVLLRRTRDITRSRDRLALVLTGGLRYSAQHDGRHASRAGAARRSGRDQLQYGVPRSQSRRRVRETARTARPRDCRDAGFEQQESAALGDETRDPAALPRAASGGRGERAAASH